MHKRIAPIAIISLQVIAFWPVWKWYVLRTLDTSDEPWGVLALITALGFTFLRKISAVDGQRRFTAVTLLLLLYVASYHFLPPLLRATIAVTAIGATLSSLYLGRSLHLAVWGLLLLSLPVLPSLQFYLGYPMRVFVGCLAAPLLQMTGFSVIREGTYLNWGGTLIWIDAPCSGVRMLWSGFYLTFTASCYYQITTRKVCTASLFALLAVLLGNTLRATALFYIESGIVQLPAWSHDAVGVTSFLFTSIAVIWWIQRGLS